MTSIQISYSCLLLKLSPTVLFPLWEESSDLSSFHWLTSATLKKIDNRSVFVTHTFSQRAQE